MLTDAECDEVLAEMASRGEFATRGFLREFSSWFDINRPDVDPAWQKLGYRNGISISENPDAHLGAVCE